MPDHRGVLSAAQRRYVLQYLAGREEVVTLDELAEWITLQDGGRTNDAERVAIALHHCHLPKLTEADLVGYDPDTRTVESTPDVGTVAARLPTATVG